MPTVPTADPTPDLTANRWSRNLFYFAAALAIAYALFAGLHTVDSFDSGWQIATGRYIVQHHTIPSSDVLSHTAAGKEWIYPWLSQVILYLIFAGAGFAGLSLLCMLATVGTIGILLMDRTTAVAVLAALAVPSIVYRTNARAELFSTVLFAAFWMLLWLHHRGRRVPLWLLPLCMLAWVNLHLAFVAGFACMAAYLLFEAEACLSVQDRKAAIARVRRTVPWLILTSLATLINPWGYRIFLTSQRQAEITPYLSSFIGEWARPHLTPALLPQVFSPRDPDSSFLWLILSACVAVAIGIWKKHFAWSATLAAAAFLGLRYLRLQGFAAILIVVLAGTLLSLALSQPKVRRGIAIATVSCLFVLVTIWGFDLISNRVYVRTGQITTFGVGPSWWYPIRAADFIRRNHLPREIFNPYNLGDFVAWWLGPEYKTYVDGRAIPFGLDLLLHQQELLTSPPDGPLWETETKQHNVNIVFLSVARYGGLSISPLRPFCDSNRWGLVYLDEVSAVFVRQAVAPSVRRLRCADIKFQEPEGATRIARFNFDANAAAVLFVLGRNDEALHSADSAAQLYDDGNLQLTRGQILQAMGRVDEAEKAYRLATEWKRSDAMYLALARFYAGQRRYPEAEGALRTSAALSYEPHQRWRQMGQLHNVMQKPQDALRDFDRADELARSRSIAPVFAQEFFAQTANGRARAYRTQNNLAEAVRWQEKTTELVPENAAYWNELAELYAQTNQPGKANAARERAAQLQLRTTIAP